MTKASRSHSLKYAPQTLAFLFSPQEAPKDYGTAGGGFAGLDAALSAARRRSLEGRGPDDLRIVMVAPEPTLEIRPRLYEPQPETLAAPFGDVLVAVGLARQVDDLLDAAERAFAALK